MEDISLVFLHANKHTSFAMKFDLKEAFYHVNLFIKLICKTYYTSSSFPDTIFFCVVGVYVKDAEDIPKL